MRRHRVYIGDGLNLGRFNLKADIMLTDPPYLTSDVVGSFGKRENLPVGMDTDLLFAANTYKLIFQLAEQMDVKIMGLFGNDYSVVSYVYSSLGTPYTFNGFVVWDKKAGKGNIFRKTLEFVAVFQRVKLKSCIKGMHPIPYIAKTLPIMQNRWHVAEKPIEVLEYILSVFKAALECNSLECKTIVDPFGGSMGIVLAAERMNMNSIVAEINEEVAMRGLVRISRHISTPIEILTEEGISDVKSQNNGG